MNRKRHSNYSDNCQKSVKIIKRPKLFTFFVPGENENEINLLLLTNTDTIKNTTKNQLKIHLNLKIVKILTLLSPMKNWMIFWGR